MEYLVCIAGQIAESGEEIIKSCWQKMRQAQKIIRISRGGKAPSINYIISLNKIYSNRLLASQCVILLNDSNSLRRVFCLSTYIIETPQAERGFI